MDMEVSVADIGYRSDWTDEDAYWRSNYHTRPYASSERSYADYQSGYRYGYDSAHRYADQNWDEVEPYLSRDWSTYEHRGTSTWEQIKGAVRDAWDRITRHRMIITK
jgi:hypothetical protein